MRCKLIGWQWAKRASRHSLSEQNRTSGRNDKSSQPVTIRRYFRRHDCPLKMLFWMSFFSSLPFDMRMTGIPFTRLIWVVPIDWWLSIRAVTRLFWAVPIGGWLPIRTLTRLNWAVPIGWFFADQNAHAFGQSCFNRQVIANQNACVIDLSFSNQLSPAIQNVHGWLELFQPAGSCQSGRSQAVPIGWFLPIIERSRVWSELFQSAGSCQSERSRVWFLFICCQDEDEDEAQVVGCYRDQDDGCHSASFHSSPPFVVFFLLTSSILSSLAVHFSDGHEKRNIARRYLLVVTTGPCFEVPGLFQIDELGVLWSWITPLGHRA